MEEDDRVTVILSTFKFAVKTGTESKFEINGDRVMTIYGVFITISTSI